MISSLLLAAVPFVSFPAQGARLPAIDHVYLAGAVAKGDTNVVVNGANVPVYRTGAWVTLIETAEGSNDVSIVSQSGEATNVWFRVAKKPVADPNVKPAPEKVWKKLDYAKNEPKEPPTNKAPHEVTIVIDAGHGGEDTGAKSPHGFYEKSANLLVAERLKAALLARGYNVVMTRETDVFIPLYDRPKVAHANNADALCRFITTRHPTTRTRICCATTRFIRGIL
jgi:N-acetylmuramoyl-L-alanine amidase